MILIVKRSPGINPFDVMFEWLAVEAFIWQDSLALMNNALLSIMILTWRIQLLQLPIQTHSLPGLDLCSRGIRYDFGRQDSEHSKPFFSGARLGGPEAPFVGQVVELVGEGVGGCAHSGGLCLF